MISKIFLLVAFFFLFLNQSEGNRTYHKEYYPNGSLKVGGWLKDGVKTDYWKFYNSNGVLAEEGHFQGDRRDAYWHFYNNSGQQLRSGHYTNGSKTGWWLFYNEKGRVNYKCQLNNGIKNGYCLQYLNEKLTSAQKYKNGKKIKEWFSFGSFKQENSLSDLK